MAVNSQNWLDAQYSVLGAILLAPETAPMVMQELRDADFSGQSRTVFQAMRKLFSENVPIDPVSVNAKLGGKYNDFLIQLMQITPTASGVEYYISLCRDQSKSNRLRELAAQIVATEDPEELRKLQEQTAGLGVSHSKVRITTMADAMRDFMAEQQKKPDYLSWPIPELNGVLFTEPGDFVVLGGYPSAGKTAFALQCLWHIADRRKVGFFSLETTAKKLFSRQIAAISQIGMGKIKHHAMNQKDWDKVCAMSADVVAKNVELVDAAGFTVDDIRAVTLMRGYQVIFVDYLQLLQGPGTGRVEQVTGISIGLHTLAQSLGVTVIALSQLSRLPKDNPNKLPDMSSLRESGQIEQDADAILLLSLANHNDRDGARVLQVAKNKEGTRPDMVLDFHGDTQTFAKAKNTQAVLDKFISDGKKAQRRISIPDPMAGQMELLPEDTEVPFHD